MPEGGGTSIGVLTTQFMGDLSGIKASIKELNALFATEAAKKRTFRAGVDVRGVAKEFNSAMAKSDNFKGVGKQLSGTISTAVQSSSMSQLLGRSMLPDFSKYQKHMKMVGSELSRHFGVGLNKSFDDYSKRLSSAGFQKRLGAGIDTSKFIHYPPPPPKPPIGQRPPPHWTDGTMQRYDYGGAAMSMRPATFTPPKIDMSEFKRSIDDVSASMLKLGAGITALVSGPLAKFSKSSVAAASDFVEWNNVFEQAYKTVLPEASQKVKDFARDFDLSMKTTRYLYADIGELLAGLGFSEKESLVMTERMNRILGDLVSFRNIVGGIPRATRLAFMGMLGNSRSVKTLGIALRQNSKEFIAQEQALMKANDYTMQQARAVAVLMEIEKQARYANDDYARTWMTVANSARRLGESLIELKVAFGLVLSKGLQLNWVISGMSVAARAVAAVLKIIPLPLKTVIGLMTLATITIGPLTVALGLLGFGLSNVMRGYSAFKSIIVSLPKMLTWVTYKMNAYTASVVANAVAKRTLAKSSILSSKAMAVHTGTVISGTVANTAFVATLRSIAATIFLKVIPAMWAFTVSMMKNPLVLAFAAAILAIRYAWDRISVIDWGKFFEDSAILRMAKSISQDLVMAFRDLRESYVAMAAEIVEVFSIMEKTITSSISHIAAAIDVLGGGLVIKNEMLLKRELFSYIEPAKMDEFMQGIRGEANFASMKGGDYIREGLDMEKAMSGMLSVVEKRTTDGRIGGIKTLSKQYASEMKSVWNPENILENIGQRMYEWLDGRAFGGDDAAGTGIGGKDSGVELPKLASAALLGTSEGVAAMNRPQEELNVQHDIRDNTKQIAESIAVFLSRAQGGSIASGPQEYLNLGNA